MPLWFYRSSGAQVVVWTVWVLAAVIGGTGSDQYGLATKLRLAAKGKGGIFRVTGRARP